MLATTNLLALTPAALGVIAKPLIAELYSAVKHKLSDPSRSVTKALNTAEIGKRIYL